MTNQPISSADNATETNLITDGLSPGDKIVRGVIALFVGGIVTLFLLSIASIGLIGAAMYAVEGRATTWDQLLGFGWAGGWFMFTVLFVRKLHLWTQGKSAGKSLIVGRNR